ncbi:MAG: hypothetical protein II342_01415 [Clostridia bacterium]|nr:hypothetical protein [Clostridia bacterium]
MIFPFLLIAVSAFLIGFILGSNNHKPSRAYKPRMDSDYERIQKEYENFLNYDGTEQQ